MYSTDSTHNQAYISPYMNAFISNDILTIIFHIKIVLMPKVFVFQYRRVYQL